MATMEDVVSNGNWWGPIAFIISDEGYNKKKKRAALTLTQSSWFLGEKTTIAVSRNVVPS